jgi:hypothetical protein
LIRATSCRTRERRSLGPPCQSAQIPQNQHGGQSRPHRRKEPAAG